MFYITRYQEFKLLSEASNTALDKYVGGQLIDPPTFGILKRVDFTRGKLLDSICRFYLELSNNGVNLQESILLFKKYLDLLKVFSNRKADFRDVSTNLYDYKTFAQLKDVFDSNELRLYGAYPSEQVPASADFDILQNDDNFFSVRIINLIASHYFGGEQGWCVADYDHFGKDEVARWFKKYTIANKGTIYYFYDKKMDKRNKFQKMLLSVFPGNTSYELKGVSNEVPTHSGSYVDYLTRRGVDTSSVINLGRTAKNIGIFTDKEVLFITDLGLDMASLDKENGYITLENLTLLHQSHIDDFERHIHKEGIKIKFKKPENAQWFINLEIHQASYQNLKFLEHPNIDTTNVVGIEISYSNIKNLDGIPQNVKNLDISDCRDFVSLNGVNPQKLEHINLRDLPKLSSIEPLTDIEHITIQGCPNINRLSNIPKHRRGLITLEDDGILDTLTFSRPQIQKVGNLSEFGIHFTHEGHIIFSGSSKYIEDGDKKYILLKRHISQDSTWDEKVLISLIELWNVLKLPYVIIDPIVTLKNITSNTLDKFINTIDLKLSNPVSIAIQNSPRLTTLDLANYKNVFVYGISGCNALKSASFCRSTKIYMTSSLSQERGSVNFLNISDCRQLKDLDVEMIPPSITKKIALTITEDVPLILTKEFVEKKLIDILILKKGHEFSNESSSIYRDVIARNDKLPTEGINFPIPVKEYVELAKAKIRNKEY